MLFTDNHVTSSYALRAIDSEIDAVIKGESKQGIPSIVLDGLSNSICAINWSECRSKLEAALQTFTTYYGTPGSQAHLAAVLNTGLGGYGAHAEVRLSQIVAHDTYYPNSLSPIEQWVAYCALRLLFQTASNRFYSGADKRGDRYERKFEFYSDKADRIWSQIVSQGLPIVISYLPCPGALHEWQSGVWDATNLSFTTDQANTNADDQGVRVAMTWYDANHYVSQTAKFNAESGPSEVLSTVIPAGTLLNINIASLFPPTAANLPNVGFSQGIVPRLVATHYNIYVGLDQDGAPMWLQNPTGIPVAQQSYTVPATTVTGSYQMQKGQVPNGMGSGNLIFGAKILRT